MIASVAMMKMIKITVMIVRNFPEEEDDDNFNDDNQYDDDHNDNDDDTHKQVSSSELPKKQWTPTWAQTSFD